MSQPRFMAIVAIVAIAVVAAVGATFGMRGVLEAPKAQHKIMTRPVVVSLRDISEGRAIDRTGVALADWPVGTVPAGAYRVVDSVIGHIARIGIYKGEVIVPGRLMPDSVVGARR
jgi:pilus assembly protein CpaB